MRAHAVSERVPADISDPGRVGATAQGWRWPDRCPLPYDPGRRPGPFAIQADGRGEADHLVRSQLANETERVMTLPGALVRSLLRIVGEPHVLTGDATAGFAVDWTGRFQGHTSTVICPKSIT
jgi:hypothetical protein